MFTKATLRYEQSYYERNISYSNAFLLVFNAYVIHLLPPVVSNIFSLPCFYRILHLAFPCVIGFYFYPTVNTFSFCLIGILEVRVEELFSARTTFTDFKF